MYFTLTGIKYSEGEKSVRPGKKVMCRKEPDNPVDSEAVRVEMEGFGRIGYIANSVHTVAGGTSSSGRIYDKVNDEFSATIKFTLHGSAICEVDAAEKPKK